MEQGTIRRSNKRKREKELKKLSLRQGITKLDKKAVIGSSIVILLLIPVIYYFFVVIKEGSFVIAALSLFLLIVSYIKNIKEDPRAYYSILLLISCGGPFAFILLATKINCNWSLISNIISGVCLLASIAKEMWTASSGIAKADQAEIDKIDEEIRRLKK